MFTSGPCTTLQGGDVVDGTGKGKNLFQLPDETFQFKHDAAGCPAMASNGEAHTAATQFYITQNPLKWLDGKRVVFGKVLTEAGLETIRAIEATDTNNERPVPEVVISGTRVLIEPAAQ
jgi:cyclophilin family peptidyl-prolyl cis-trans isomerase